MEKKLQFFSIALSLLILSACTSTNSLTNCPSFKKSNKSPKGIAFNFSKKKQKKQKAITKQNKKVQPKVEWANTVAPVQPIALTSIENNSNQSAELVSVNKVNLNHYLFEELSNKINKQFDLKTSTASLKTVLEEQQTKITENLGLGKLLDKAVVEPLSKKEIKQIKKTVKAEIRASLKDNEAADGDVEDGKAAAAVSYLFLVGLLISILALHQKGNTFSAFHIRQSIGITIMAVILTIIAWIPIAGWIAAAVGSILLLINWIIGLINSLNGTSKPVFFFGKAFQNWFKGVE